MNQSGSGTVAKGAPDRPLQVEHDGSGSNSAETGSGAGLGAVIPRRGQRRFQANPVQGGDWKRGAQKEGWRQTLTGFDRRGHDIPNQFGGPGDAEPAVVVHLSR